MKKILFFLAIVLSLIVSCAQQHQKEKNALIQKVNASYEIYPTTNMWNFIKLNTRNGKMWIVQYSIDKDENRFETCLNKVSLIAENEEMDGRFKLQPTQNIYTFILLDQIDGRTWQVQWSFDENQRFVIPIK